MSSQNRQQRTITIVNHKPTVRIGLVLRSSYDRGNRKHLTDRLGYSYRKCHFCISNHFTCRICCFQSCMHISETGCGQINDVRRCLRYLYLTICCGRVKSGLLRGRLSGNLVDATYYVLLYVTHVDPPSTVHRLEL